MQPATAIQFDPGQYGDGSQMLLVREIRKGIFTMTAPTRAASAAAVLLALAAPAKAEVATLTYEAVLDGIPSIGWPDGVTVSGTLIYDTDATPEISDATSARYLAISHAIQLSWNGSSASFVGDSAPEVPPLPRIAILNDSECGSSVNVCDQFSSSARTQGTFLGFPVESFAVIFAEASPAPDGLSSIALPTTLDSFPDDGSSALIVIQDPSGPARPGIVARLTTFNLAIDADYVLSCEGFYEPFDRALSLPARSRRVIPLRMNLLAQDGFSVGADTITAPVVSVSHTGAIGGGELDELVDAAGRATEGNSFLWDDVAGEWKFNLGTRPFASGGTYTVSVTAGDDDYAIDPTCIGTFIRQ